MMRITQFLLLVLLHLAVAAAYKNVQKCSTQKLISNTASLKQKWSTSLYAGRTPMVPYYLDQTRRDYMWMDIYNALGRDRTLFVSRYIDDEAANQLISSLIYLGGKSGTEPIRIYFNVPGAMAKPTLAVYDVLRSLTCPIETINMGLTVGLSCLLVAAGTPSKRFVTPNARFLMGKAGMDDAIRGQSTEIALQVKEVMKDNKRGLLQLGRLCRVDPERMLQDMERDFYLTAPEAVQYGIVDAVLIPNQPIKIMRNREIDNDVINFGHFSEVRPVRGGPLSRGFNDPVIPKGIVTQLDLCLFYPSIYFYHYFLQIQTKKPWRLCVAE